MRKLILKIATVALLVLASIVGSISLQHATSVPGVESVATGSSFSPLSSNVGSSPVSGFDGAGFADHTLNGVTDIAASSADLIAAGACAALIGCCILGLALMRLRSRSAPRASWTTALRRTLSAICSPGPLASPIRPSLTLLSISRT